MKKIKIWFNHWFTTAYHLIYLMKKNHPEFYLIGTSTNPQAMYQFACDEFLSEPDQISETDYLDFCLKFCQEHEISVFVPRRFLKYISENSGRFTEIGVKLFADTNPELAEILDDKIKTYEFFKTDFPELIPEYDLTYSLEEFRNSYEILKQKHSRICYKLAQDEGARSFRVLDETTESMKALLNPPNTKIHPETAYKILSQYDFSVPVLIMPYLDGMEISADCLRTPSGTIVIPRYKTGGRFAEIRFDSELICLCEKMAGQMQIAMPFNIQFRKYRNKLYLLEINPRMSGGLQLSCEGAGINIPEIAVSQLLGITQNWSYPEQKKIICAHLETPVIFPSIS
ncbi:MAG: ATP-grasp domain-containing protein [Oscillospiraceae bacterium]|nr:ATP-grasp domain-containing protein [Oscillospiraceae bacterium]